MSIPRRAPLAASLTHAIDAYVAAIKPAMLTGSGADHATALLRSFKRALLDLDPVSAPAAAERAQLQLASVLLASPVLGSRLQGVALVRDSIQRVETAWDAASDAGMASDAGKLADSSKMPQPDTVAAAAAVALISETERALLAELPPAKLVAWLRDEGILEGLLRPGAQHEELIRRTPELLSFLSQFVRVGGGSVPPSLPHSLTPSLLLLLPLPRTHCLKLCWATCLMPLWTRRHTRVFATPPARSCRPLPAASTRRMSTTSWIDSALCRRVCSMPTWYSL